MKYLLSVLLVLSGCNAQKGKCHHFDLTVNILNDYWYHHNQYYVEVDIAAEGIKRRYPVFKHYVICRGK